MEDEEEVPLEFFLNQEEFSKEIIKLKTKIEDHLTNILQFIEDKEKEFSKFIKLDKVFTFKLNNIIVNFIDIEKTILNSAIAEYYEKILEDYYPHNLNINLLSRQLDSYLTQYFSILDVFIKGISSSSADLQKIEGLGDLYNKENQMTPNERKIFETFFDKVSRESFETLKDYRNYLIHHGTLAITPQREYLEGEYSINSYKIFKVKKTGSREYSTDRKWAQRVALLIRISLNDLLDSLEKSLDQTYQYLWNKEGEKNPQDITSP